MLILQEGKMRLSRRREELTNHQDVWGEQWVSREREISVTEHVQAWPVCLLVTGIIENPNEISDLFHS